MRTHGFLRQRVDPLDHQMVTAVTWGVESKIREALHGIPVPVGCPEGLLIVPEFVPFFSGIIHTA